MASKHENDDEHNSFLPWEKEDSYRNDKIKEYIKLGERKFGGRKE